MYAALQENRKDEINFAWQLIDGFIEVVLSVWSLRMDIFALEALC